MVEDWQEADALGCYLELVELARNGHPTALKFFEKPKATSMTRLLVCGGRDFTDEQFLFDALDDLHQKLKVKLLIHGAAKGADFLSSVWATQRGIPTYPFPAEWNKYGTRAGPIRNFRMLKEGKPDVVLAFPGSHGTNHMIRVARQAGIRVVEMK